MPNKDNLRNPLHDLIYGRLFRLTFNYSCEGILNPHPKLQGVDSCIILKFVSLCNILFIIHSYTIHIIFIM